MNGSDSQNKDTERERKTALLTRRQREYLRSEKEFESGQSERDMRYKIRERIKNGLLDFELLADELEPRDRKQIFKDVRTAALRGDEHVNVDEMPQRDEVEGLVHTVAFLYLAARDADLPFEKVIELGISEANFERPFVPSDVEVRIDERVEFDYDEIFGKIERGERISEIEYSAVKSLLLKDLERYVELCEWIDLNVSDKFDAGEELTREESLVVVGLVNGGDLDSDASNYDFETLLDDEVMRDFGLYHPLSQP
jgi:hypothetical protein